MSHENAIPTERPRICRLAIPGDPQSKGRPRVYQGHGITPQKNREAEQHVRNAWLDKYAHLPPYEGPVAVTLVFWMASNRGRDWDNLAKLVTDALNGIAYVDDRQIIEASVSVRRPDPYVKGRKGRLRKRRSGDPPTWNGIEYQPHTRANIHFLKPTYQTPDKETDE